MRDALAAFVIEHPLGAGGMGAVHAARHRDSGLPVALKVLTGAHAANPVFRQFFRSEVRAVAALDHPGIVPILDHGETARPPLEGPAGRSGGHPTPWLAMALASGGTLRSVRPGVRWPVLRGVALSLLDSLAHAHARGVIHRDLKPDNILLGQPADLAPGLLLTDFGIAHLRFPSDHRTTPDPPTDGSLSHLMPTAGTPAYMAPEQLRGDLDRIGPATDLFGLGCVLLDLILDQTDACSTPDGHWPQQRIRRLEVLALQRPDLPPALAPWLGLLVHPDVERRFGHAADAAHALRALSGPTEPPLSMASLVAELLHARRHAPHPSVGGETRLDRQPGVATAVAGMAEPRTTLDPLTAPAGHPTRTAPAATTSALRVAAPAEARGERLPIPGPGAGETALEVVRAAGVPPCPPCWRSTTPEPPRRQVHGLGLGLFGLRALPVVGRDSECDRLWGHLRAVHEVAQTRAVVLRGPSGAGKSRLAEWLVERAEELEVAVALRAVHSPVPGPRTGVEAMFARSPAVRVLLSETHGDPPSGTALTPEERRALGTLIAAAEGAPSALTFLRAEERWYLHHRLLDAIAVDRPVLLWLDDVQWGPDALALAAYLLRVASSRGLLIVATVRDEALAGQPLAGERLGQLMALPGAHAVPLAPLGPNAIATLVQGMAGLAPDLAWRIARRVDGNPLFAVQIVADWVQKGLLAPTAHGFVLTTDTPPPLPESLSVVWREQLDGLVAALGGRGGGALRLASVLGQEIHEGEWRALAAEVGVRIPDGLVDAMRQRRLARPLAEGWAFAHGLLRELLEEDSRSSGHWPEDNAACASMLLRSAPSPEQLPHERVGRHLREANHPLPAARHLVAAARAAEQRSDAGLALALLREAEEALRSAPSANAALTAELHTLRATVLLLQRRTAAASEEVERAFRAVQDTGADHLEAAALAVRAHVLRMQSRHGEAEQDLLRALELHGRTGDAQGTAQALRALAWVELLQAHLDRAEVHAREALERFRALGDERGAAGALRTLGDVARNRAAHDEAAELFGRARQIFASLGNISGVSECVHGIAECHRLLGRLESAEAGYRETIRLDRSHGCEDTSIPRINLALVQLAQGRVTEAREALEEILHETVDRGAAGDAGYLHFVIAACLAGEARWVPFDRHLASAREELERSGHVDLDLAMAGERGADWAQEAGQHERAARLGAMAADQWRRLGHEARAQALDARLSGQGRP